MGADSYTLSISGAASIDRLTSIDGDFTVETDYVTYDSPFSVGVIACNKCGQSPITYTTGIVKGSGEGEIIPPVIEFRSKLITDQSEIKSVKIYNLSGFLVYSNNAIDDNFDIKSTVLTDGIYIIEKFDGENRTSAKVMLKR